MLRLNNPSIIDVEASGFGGESYPIEVGVALDSGKRFCTLIAPAAEWSHWDDQAEQIHNISRAMLHAHGKPVSDVADALNDLLAGATLYSDGWVVDKPWLTRLFHAAGRPMRFSVSPLEMILTEQQMALWHRTREQISRQANVQRHRASNDAWIIQETFRKTLKIAKG